MGLDQYAYVTPDTGDLPDVDLEWGNDDNPYSRPRGKIAQWRKHPDLHRWMEQLYREREGTSPDFNCATLRLDLDDIQELQAAVEKDALPTNEGGFFFGTSHPDDKWDTLQFCYRAREAILSGMAVYYDSWW